MKASFAHLQLLELKEVSHKSFVCTSSTVGSWRKSRTKASFSHLQLLEFEGSLARNAFLRDSGIVHFAGKTCLAWCVGKLIRRTLAEHVRFYRDHGRIGRAVELPVQASVSQFQLSKFEGSLPRKLRAAPFSHLQLLEFEGGLARKLRFHILNCWKLKDVYCVLQFSLRRSQCNGCVKVAWRRGCVRNTIFFWSWTSLSYLTGCIKVAIVICQQIFSI